MKKTQSGFALVEGLLIILILAIIGFGGYYVWHTQKQTDKTLDTAASTSQKAASTSAQASNQKYLTIKEWGVKFKLSGDSQDAYYVIPEESNNGQYINIDSHDLDALIAFDGSSCKGEYIGIMGRYQKDDPALTSDGIDGAIGERKAVGNYVYTFSTHKQYASGCIYDGNNNYDPIPANKAVYDKKVAAYGTMYETILAE